MADKVKVSVLSGLVDGAKQGDVVELDPDVVDIGALIAGGHVETATERTATRSTAAATPSGGNS
jgi:hypothetical protein